MRILSDGAIQKLANMHKHWAGSRRGDGVSPDIGSPLDYTCFWGVIGEGGVTAYNTSTKALGKGECILHYAGYNADDDRIDVESDTESGEIPYSTTVYSISAHKYEEGDRVIILQHMDGTLFIIEQSGKRYAITPPAGIPAASKTDDSITPGAAVCDIYRWNGSVYLKTDTVTVRNPYPDSVAGDRLISYSPDAWGNLTVDAEACKIFP